MADIPKLPPYDSGIPQELLETTISPADQAKALAMAFAELLGAKDLYDAATDYAPEGLYDLGQGNWEGAIGNLGLGGMALLGTVSPGGRATKGAKLVDIASDLARAEKVADKALDVGNVSGKLEKMEKAKFPLGKKIIGWRYGKAPESGFSTNQMTGRREAGVSMAQVGHHAPVDSFAVMNLKEKKVPKYYYEGQIAGAGGDANEIVLTELTPISKGEYSAKLKDPEVVSISRDLINSAADDRLGLIEQGWNLGWSADEVMAKRDALLDALSKYAVVRKSR